nr:MAG TPA: hypothetical protein [Bacteriophage sp.]
MRNIEIIDKPTCPNSFIYFYHLFCCRIDFGFETL